MYLKELHLTGFKNYQELKLQFSDKINCFTGQNAAGKTNILDAIYLLSLTKSFFNTPDKLIVNTASQDNFYSVIAIYEVKNSIETIQVKYVKNNRKIFKKNDKEYPRLSDHIGLLPLVMISPNDVFLISEGSELRRRFLDIIISQFDKEYLHNLIQYNTALKQRNAILKKMDFSHTGSMGLFEVWDQKLIEYGTPIFEERKAMTETLTTYFNQFYTAISNDQNELSVKYRSQLFQKPLKELLENNFENDKYLKYTSVGIHKDDLNFTIDGLPLKKIGSQGQQKSLLIALKLAEYEILKQGSGKKPLLLLDDVFDKLDSFRVGKVMELVAEKDYGQIFITDTHPDRMKQMVEQLNIPAALFKVNNGTVEPIENDGEK